MKNSSSIRISMIAVLVYLNFSVLSSLEANSGRSNKSDSHNAKSNKQTLKESGLGGVSAGAGLGSTVGISFPGPNHEGFQSSLDSSRKFNKFEGRNINSGYPELIKNNPQTLVQSDPSSFFIIPTKGTLTQGFQNQFSLEPNGSAYLDRNLTTQPPKSGKRHKGEDIAGVGVISNTDKIFAAGDGLVVGIYMPNQTSGLGHLVIIFHGALFGKYVYSLYAHMGNKADNTSFISDKIRLGKFVQRGTELGRQGNSGATAGQTGIHLHFQLQVSDQPLFDPNGSLIAPLSSLISGGSSIPASHIPFLKFSRPEETSGGGVVYEAGSVNQRIASVSTTWLPDGSLVTQDGSAFYLIQNGKKRLIPNESVFYSYGFDFNAGIRVSPSLMSCFPTGPTLGSPPVNRFLKRSDGTIFEVTDQNTKFAFATAAAFLGRFGTFNEVRNATDSEISSIPNDPVRNIITSQVPDGAVIRGLTNQTVYFVSNGKKRGITSLNTLHFMGLDENNDILTLPDALINSIETDSPISESTLQSCGTPAVLSGDRFPPQVTVPATFLQSTTGAVNLQGNATDAGNGNSGISTVLVNGQPASGGSVSGSGQANWSKSVIVPAGFSTILVEGIDGSPNQNSTPTLITVYSDPSSADLSPPSLSIASPTNGQVVSVDNVTVTFTTSDSGFGNNGISKVIVNGEEIPGATSSGANPVNRSVSIQLSPGNNSLTVTSFDGSSNQNSRLQTVNIFYQPVTAPDDFEWSNSGSLPNDFLYGASVSLNNRIYLLGGSIRFLFKSFNPSTGSFSALPDIPGNGIFEGGAVALNGKIYAIGNGFENQLFIFDPTTNAWSTSSNSMPGPVRRGACVVAVDNKILVISGGDSSLVGISTVYEFDPATSSWRTRNPIPSSRIYASGVVFNGLVYVLGGRNGSQTDTIFSFNNSTNTWTQVNTQLPEPRDLGSAVLFGSKIYYLGGYSSHGSTATVFEFSPDSNNCKQLFNSLVNPVNSHTASIGAGAIYLFGGENNFIPLANFEKGNPVSCTLSLSRTEISLPASGGSFNFTISATSEICPWSINGSTIWAPVSQIGGTGTKVISCNVQSNSGPERLAQLQIGLNRLTINQSSGCATTVPISTITVQPIGGLVQIGIQTNPSCNWMVSSIPSWTSLISPSSGFGDATVSINVTPNNTGVTRQSVVSFGNSFATLVQNPQPPCSSTFIGASTIFGPVGGTSTVTVSAGPGCSWSVVSNVGWLQLPSGTNGVGDGVLIYTVSPNPGSQRVGTISLGSQIFTVTQSSGCTYSINPTSTTTVAAGGNGNIAVTASDLSCPWTATSNVGWITFSSGETGSGNGTVNYIVAANSGAQRTGTITAAGQTYTVTQAGNCSFVVSPTTISLPAIGGTTAISVTTDSGCAWTATSNSSFLNISSGASGTGNGTVQLTVRYNNGIPRLGTLTVAGQAVTANQLARNASTPGQFRPSNGFVYIRNSNDSGFADREFFYGLAGDIPVAGDWNGDGIDTIGIFRNGTFFLRNSNDSGFADIQFPFGAPGDIPIVGDWDGDGIDTIGIVRGNTIFLRNLNTAGNADIQAAYGTSTDIFITGDWNGDGVDTIGCFRPSNGFVYIRNSNTTGIADFEFFYGQAGDRPVVGDWNADGIDTIGIVRGNQWFLRNSNTSGFADIQYFYGTETDVPIVGDWNGL